MLLPHVGGVLTDSRAEHRARAHRTNMTVRNKVAQGPMGPFQGWRPRTLASSRHGREGRAGTHALTTHSFMHQQVPYAISCLALGRDANHGNDGDGVTIGALESRAVTPSPLIRRAPPPRTTPA